MATVGKNSSVSCQIRNNLDTCSLIVFVYFQIAHMILLEHGVLWPNMSKFKRLLSKISEIFNRVVNLSGIKSKSQ